MQEIKNIHLLSNKNLQKLVDENLKIRKETTVGSLLFLQLLAIKEAKEMETIRPFVTKPKGERF